MGDQNFPGEGALRNATDGRAAVWAGVAAGVGSALAQVLLWLAFTDAFPQALFRDARLTAAILLGQGVLPPPTTFDAVIMLISALIHFALSIVYGLASAWVLARAAVGASLLIGALSPVPRPATTWASGGNGRWLRTPRESAPRCARW